MLNLYEDEITYFGFSDFQSLFSDVWRTFQFVSSGISSSENFRHRISIQNLYELLVTWLTVIV